MAYPVILVDSTNGSATDTAASGAGPTTALSGTTDASTDGTGLIVTLTANTNLTNVATDGSHVIFLNDSTAGARNFGKITAKAGSGGATPTVTVSDAFGLNLTAKSWAIGGVRATIAGTNSKKLFDNNVAAGDAMPGWTVQMQSGHTETITATLTFRRVGTLLNGPIKLQGASGAATMPILTFSNNGNMLVVSGSTGTAFQDFELRNSHGTKTASVGITANTGTRVNRVRCTASGANQVWRFILTGTSTIIESCEIANCASHAISLASNGCRIQDCLIRDNAGDGINCNAAPSGSIISGNLIVRNANGINDIRTGTTAIGGNHIFNNTIHGNTGSGMIITGDGSTVTVSFNQMRVENNNFTGNGAYGINFSGSPVQESLDGGNCTIRSNNFGTGGTANTTAACSLSSAIADATNLTVDPGYSNTATNNFAVATAVKGKGFPTAVNIANGASNTASSVTIGAAQAASSGGLFFNPGMGGGCNG